MAGSSLGRLTLDLAVRLQEFLDGMNRADRETEEHTRNMQQSVTAFREHLANELGGTQLGSIIESFNQRFGSMEGSALKLSGAVAGMVVGGIAVGIGALSKLAIETAKADAEMSVLANRANTSVKNFQTLGVAVQGLGVSQEQLGSILADTQEKLGEFTATGGGEASDFFNVLRDNTEMTDNQIKKLAKTLTGKDGIEALQLIKNKLDEVGASAQEQRFVFESLGNDLGNMAVIFADGGKILNQYRDALEEAGVIKTKEAIEQSQLLAAQTQSVQQRFDGFKSQLAQQMMPVLNSLGQYFFSSGEKGSAFGGIIQGVGVIAKGVASILMVFGGAIALLGDTIGQFVAQIGNVSTTAMNVLMADGIEAKMQALSQGFQNFKTMGSDYIQSTIDRFKSLDTAIGNAVNGQTVATDKLTQANLAVIQSQNARTAGVKIDTKTAEENRKAHEKLNKEKEKGAKAQDRLVGISGNTGIGTGAHLDIRIADGSRRLTDAELNRFQAGGKNLTAWRKTSEFGHRKAPTAGASTFHRGVDFAMPSGTPITSKVAIKDVKTYNSGNGAGYISLITFTDGLQVKLLHQSPNVMGLKRGSSNMGDAGKINDELISLDEKYQSKQDQERERQEKERQRKLEQDNKDRLSLTQYYATQAEKIESEHTTKIAEINRLYKNKSLEWTRLTNLENQRYEDAKFDYDIAKRLQYAEGEEKIELEHKKKLKQIERDYASDPTERDRLIALQNQAYQKDLANFKWVQGEKARAQKALIDKIRDDINAGSMQSVNDALDASMKASMKPEDYARWSLKRDYNNNYSALYTNYANRQNQINEVDSNTGNFKIESEDERNALLEAAKQEHLNNLYAMEVDHAGKVKDLDDQQKAMREQSYSDMFSSMTSAAATFFGEQSSLYRAAFAMEKAYAVHKAVMNAEETYSNTYNSISAIPLIGPYIAAPMAAAATAIQIARAASIKGMQAPSVGGIAHGGLSYVPKETTYLLDKGERVLSPRQNTDLTRYLNDRQNNGSVNVYNNSSAQVTAERQPDGTVTIDVVDKMIKRSFGRIGDANSYESRQIQRHTTARFNRQ